MKWFRQNYTTSSLNFIPGPIGKTWREDYLSPKRLIMMERPFQQVSTEALQKKEKRLLLITRLLGGCMILLLLTSAYQLLYERASAVTGLPVCFLPILIINLNSLKKIRQEIHLRKQP
jgi:hypothetical protein